MAETYERAIERASVPVPGRAARVALRAGFRPADGLPRRPPRRMPSIEPELPATGRRRATRVARRVGAVAAGVAGIGLGALALDRIGIDSIIQALLAATPWWVLVGFALMCLSMLARAESWHAILRAALPGVRVRRRYATRGVMIGVLMSATLPARLGEPSRAFIVARRLGRVRGVAVGNDRHVRRSRVRRVDQPERGEQLQGHDSRAKAKLIAGRAEARRL